jgi:hypothetical protein
MSSRNAVASAILLFAACGGEGERKSCTLSEPKSCGSPTICQEVGGQPACVAPLVVRGRVTDPSGQPIAGAIVAALDANDAPATGTTATVADGGYELRIPVSRAPDGTPHARQIKLRASAATFQSFPSGLRRSFPFEVAAGKLIEGKIVFRETVTDLVLEPLAGAAGFGSIEGTVGGEPGKRGVLVVAEGPDTISAISDVDGAFVIFNAPPGSYVVRGYAAGVQLESSAVTVPAGARATVALPPRQAPLGSVSGTVSLVDAPGGSMTSVVLVVKSTFNGKLLRGEVPPGLRAPDAGPPSVAGAFTIRNVPDGSYVVLAAFENDGLVRDPDTSIGGTQIQQVQIGEGGREAKLAASFKITAGLQVMQPGAGEAPEPVAGTPLFMWKDDSSEDGYAIEVIDSLGTVVWSNDKLPRVTGGGNVSVPYGGPALTRGRFYQFRATSYRRDRVPISQTEDLRGVFIAR